MLIFLIVLGIKFQNNNSWINVYNIFKIFNTCRKIALQKRSINLHFYQVCLRVFFILNLHQHLLSTIFFCMYTSEGREKHIIRGKARGRMNIGRKRSYNFQMSDKAQLWNHCWTRKGFLWKNHLQWHLTTCVPKHLLQDFPENFLSLVL